jgi:hypothetical protein
MAFPHSIRLWREPRKDEVVSIHAGFVAGEAGLMLGLVNRLAVDESSESPPAGGRVFLRILDHDLDSGGRAGNGGGPEFG